MRVYVETNFVLELVLLQEQSPSCEQICAWAEAGRIELVTPAYALVEPLDTLRRRHAERVRLAQATEQHLRLLRRTGAFAKEVGELLGTTGLLIQSADFEDSRLHEVQHRLLRAGRVPQLDGPVIERASAIRRRLGLSGQDSLVYASVINDLMLNPAALACFLNRNSKDFEDPEIDEELVRVNCKVLSSFIDGQNYISRHIPSSMRVWLRNSSCVTVGCVALNGRVRVDGLRFPGTNPGVEESPTGETSSPHSATAAPMPGRLFCKYRTS